jgi:hypothetical protein
MEQIKQQLPNAATTLVLGILSIVLGCGVIGLVLGIIGLVISKEGKAMYEKNPGDYSGWGNLNAGRIMSIIGICLGGLSLFYLIIALVIGGSILAGLSGLM